MVALADDHAVPDEDAPDHRLGSTWPNPREASSKARLISSESSSVKDISNPKLAED